MGISGQEKKGSAKKNGGFFSKGLLKALESDHVAGGNELEVKVVGNGHCHSKSINGAHRDGQLTVRPIKPLKIVGELAGYGSALGAEGEHLYFKPYYQHTDGFLDHSLGTVN